LLQHREVLAVALADRDDHPPALAELRDQRGQQWQGDPKSETLVGGKKRTEKRNP